MTESQRSRYNQWRATAAIKFHSRPRTPVVIKPMPAHAYAATLAARVLNASR